MAQFYRHSGIVPFRGLLQTVFAGLGTAISLGIAYSYALVYIPIVHVHFLGTMFFGAGLGYLIKNAARAGRIRNRFVPSAIGLVSGLVGLYFAWGADMLARQWPQPNMGVFYAFSPKLLHFYIDWAYDNGLWSFGEHAQGPVTGIPLALVWLTEAATIVGAATVVPWDMRQWVFCENCGWWETIETNLHNFSAVDAEQIAARLKQDGVSVLRDLPLARPTDLMYLRLHLATCESCADSNYLDLEEMTVLIDKKGNAKTRSKMLVSKLLISAADVPLVKEAGPAAADPKPDAEGTTSDAEPATENTEPGERPA